MRPKQRPWVETATTSKNPVKANIPRGVSTRRCLGGGVEGRSPSTNPVSGREQSPQRSGGLRQYACKAAQNKHR